MRQLFLSASLAGAEVCGARLGSAILEWIFGIGRDGHRQDGQQVGGCGFEFQVCLSCFKFNHALHSSRLSFLVVFELGDMEVRSLGAKPPVVRLRVEGAGLGILGGKFVVVRPGRIVGLQQVR